MFTLFKKKKPLVPQQHLVVGGLVLTLAVVAYLFWQNLYLRYINWSMYEASLAQEEPNSEDTPSKNYSLEDAETITSLAIAEGLKAKPEYDNDRITTVVNNLEINQEWATGAVVFMPPGDVHGGPDSALFVARYDKEKGTWKAAIEWYSPEFSQWYKESAPLFYEPETVEWIRANY